MPQNYDFGNLCEMFKSVLKGILIANQDNRPDKISDICVCASKNIDRIQKREIIRESLNDSIKV